MGSQGVGTGIGGCSGGGVGVDDGGGGGFDFDDGYSVHVVVFLFEY